MQKVTIGFTINRSGDNSATKGLISIQTKTQKETILLTPATPPLPSYSPMHTVERVNSVKYDLNLVYVEELRVSFLNMTYYLQSTRSMQYNSLIFIHMII